MSVIEIDFVVPDTVEELLELIGDPAEEPLQPFTFRVQSLVDHDFVTLAEAPIGIYTLPKAGEIVCSVWPAQFAGPLAGGTAWSLLSNKGKLVRYGTFRFPWLARRDTLHVDVKLRGVGAQPEIESGFRLW